MSSLKSAIAIFEQETDNPTAEARRTRMSAKPVLVSKKANRIDDWAARRVESVLDAQFANGSMPA